MIKQGKWIAVCAVIMSLASAHAAETKKKKPIRSATAVGESEETYVSEDDFVGIQLRPMIGYAFINPKELNSLNSTITQARGVNSKYEIKGAANFSVTGEYLVMRQLGFGVRMDYFSSSTDAVTANINGGKLTAQSTLTALPVYATASFTQPIRSGWSVGMTGGAGIPLIYDYTTNVSGSTIQGAPNGDSVYSAAPFTWMLMGSTNYAILKNLNVRFEAMYRNLTTTQMRHSGTYGATKDGELLQDENSANVKVNASSIVAAVGVAFTF